MGGGKPARSAQERNKSARKTPRRYRLPTSHAPLPLPSPQIADHKIIFLCSPPAKIDGGRAACKERSRMQQTSAQDATMLPPSHIACNAAPAIQQSYRPVTISQTSQSMLCSRLVQMPNVHKDDDVRPDDVDSSGPPEAGVYCPPPGPYHQNPPSLDTHCQRERKVAGR